MPSIFISYAHEDRETAERLAGLLLDRGYDVWWDREILGGQPFGSEIQKQIKGADHVVVLLSPDSVSSRWVREESDLGEQLGKMVQVVIGNLDMNEVSEKAGTPTFEICDLDADLDRFVNVLDGDSKQTMIEKKRNEKWRRLGAVVQPRAIRTFGEQSFISMPLGYLSVAFASDGRQAVSGGGNGDVIVWDVETGETIRRFTTTVKKLKKARMILGVFTSMVTNRDANSVPDLAVTTVTWSNDDSFIVTGGWDAAVRIWDAASGSVLQTLRGHPSWVLSVDLSSDGRRLVSAGTDRFDEIDEGDGKVRLKRVAAGEDRTLIVWDMETGEIVHRLGEIRTPVWCARFSPDGQVIASTHHSDIKLWEAGSGREIRTMLGHEKIIHQLAFLHDGTRLVSVAEDGALKLWNVGTGDLLRTFSGHTMDVKAVAVSNDDRIVASGGVDCTIRLWDVESGHLIRTHIGHNGEVLGVDLTPDDTFLISASQDGTLKLWDVSGVRSW